MTQMESQQVNLEIAICVGLTCGWNLCAAQVDEI